MRKLISISFLFLLLLQAIPVLDFFCPQDKVLYSYIDEEKPEQKSLEKKECKEFLSLCGCFPLANELRISFRPFLLVGYLAPCLDSLTPPPDVC